MGCSPKKCAICKQVKRGCKYVNGICESCRKAQKWVWSVKNVEK